MKWLNKIIEKIIDKKFNKIIKPKIQQVEDCLNNFEIAVDVHLSSKDTLFIMIRKDKPQVKFWGIKTNDLLPIIEYLNYYKSKNITIDSDSIVRKIIEYELRRK